MDNLYLNLFYIFIVLGSVSLIGAIFIFFYFKIPKVIGDLTGKTSQKAIQKSRELNRDSGIKQYKPSSVNAKRGKITDRIDDTNRKNVSIAYGEIKTDPIGASASTTVLENVAANVSTAANFGNDSVASTTVLAENVSTEQNARLPENEPFANGQITGEATTVLSDNTQSQSTTVLSEPSTYNNDSIAGDGVPSEMEAPSEFVIEETESYSESPEIIV